MMRTRVRRGAAIVLALCIFLVLIGATYQGVATALERRQFQHPGRLVPAGAHQLHIRCSGQGTPTVVLEAPAAAMSAAWGSVQPVVAASTRVCSYDRAGLGWSEWDTLAFDPDAVPVQLHTVLANAGEEGPYVLVGQGLGAALARLTAGRYPDEIAALVLIDPPRTEPPSARPGAGTARLLPWLARTGILRVSRAFSARPVALPADAAGALSTFQMRPDHLSRSARELARWGDTVRRAGAVGIPESIPIQTTTISGQGMTALLTSRADADRAAAVILATVERLRDAH